jgi:hypothetical protein
MPTQENHQETGVRVRRTEVNPSRRQVIQFYIRAAKELEEAAVKDSALRTDAIWTRHLLMLFNWQSGISNPTIPNTPGLVLTNENFPAIPEGKCFPTIVKVYPGLDDGQDYRFRFGIYLSGPLDHLRTRAQDEKIARVKSGMDYRIKILSGHRLDGNLSETNPKELAAAYAGVASDLARLTGDPNPSKHSENARRYVTAQNLLLPII